MSSAHYILVCDILDIVLNLFFANELQAEGRGLDLRDEISGERFDPFIVNISLFVVKN